PFAAAGAVLLAALAAWYRGPFRSTPATVPKIMGRLLATSTSERHQPVVIPLSSPPDAVLLSADGREAYIVETSGNSVDVMDTRSNRITSRLPVVARPTRMALTPDGKRIYVGSQIADLSVIDTASKRVTTVPMGAPSTDLVVTPDGRKVFLASEYSGLRRLLIATG